MEYVAPKIIVAPTHVNMSVVSLKRKYAQITLKVRRRKANGITALASADPNDLAWQ